MPTAREALLDAALAALSRHPWSAVRMADLAAAARVSRQTLYNEFGSKEGLARALVRHEADAYLEGVRRLLAGPGPNARTLAAVAEWTVARAGDRPILRSLLTGAWTEGLPRPRPVRPGAPLAPVPAQRRADGGPPAPGELLATTARCAGERWAAGCELALRLALSHVVAPALPPEGQCAEPDSWRPMTPTMTRLIETILSVETRSPRNTMP
ncbi:TetR/AcrR family transcriptional regulator [Streptomyces filamentosus]|uniref:TetR family transcriptional regulator n=2 Tax=Streptomyces filamentosus TaxID=67294 RepID=A0A919EJC0_STRFL|nr:TetR/AcrR family transcriptional regulator [Streptomyces filamentosus]GHF85741.1 TetR family transcriptional regulator [Streptomyces filamentosus]